MTIGHHILNQFNRIPLSLVPTPFQKLEHISRAFSANIFCKRDDLTGFAFGGNKTRKLDFLIAEALHNHADVCIAVGAVQSNFCRIAAAACTANHLPVHLVLGGTIPGTPTGNFLLDKLFGAEIHVVGSDNWDIWEEHAVSLEKEFTRNGKKVFRMPVGGSTPIGALGYVDAFFEILHDAEVRNITIDTIIHASSSGGTQAGLIVGKIISGWHGRIIGIGVAKTAAQLADEVYNLTSATGELFGVSVTRQDVIVDNDFMGPAYAARTEACSSACRILAETEGIILDNVYTGKAAAGMLEYARRGFFSTRENVVFIHTGGGPEIFS